MERQQYRSWMKDDPRVNVYLRDLALSLNKRRITAKKALDEAERTLPKFSTIPRSRGQISGRLQRLRTEIAYEANAEVRADAVAAKVNAMLPAPKEQPITGTHKVPIAAPHILTPTGDRIPLPGEYYLEYEIKPV